MNTVLASIGVSISAIYAYFIWILVGSRFALLETMDLNNLGDFLAGVFGPIAFLWLVLGFFQQGYELRQNNNALKLQADELEKSVAQQTEMARLQALALANQSRLVQPLFEMNHIEEYFWEGDKFDSFELINSGGYCDCVNIRLLVNGVEEFQYELEPLNNGTKRSFSLADFGGQYEIHVSYRSIDGVIGARIFDVKNWFGDDGKKYPTPRQRPNKVEAGISQN